ncbi:MAG: hypothetical protein CR971_02205 [candidate division SR1 bacterium]|nr:MAG: hypothetical protein CR971_02205 [candidate division SR1 bacterium]
MSKKNRSLLILLISGLTFISSFGGVLADGNTVGISNIHHTVSDKTVNLSWDVTSGSNQVDMFLWTEQSNMFKLISTIDTFKKSTTLHVLDNGTYVVRFIPSGGGNDIRYTFVVSGVNAQQKDIVAVPKTGTTGNILLVLGFAVLLYTLYRYRRVSKR